MKCFLEADGNFSNEAIGDDVNEIPTFQGGSLGIKLLSVAVNHQCYIAPPFQDYLFCSFMVIVLRRYRVFDPTLSPSSASVALHIN
jgi:hypothetical protein